MASYSPHSNVDLMGEMEIMSKGRLVKARLSEQDAPNVLWYWIATGNCYACEFFQNPPPKCLNSKITDAEFFDKYVFVNTCPQFKAGVDRNSERADTLDVMKAIGLVAGKPSQKVVVIVNEPWSLALAARAHSEMNTFLDMARAADSGNANTPDRGEYVDLGDDLERPAAPPQPAP